MTLYLASLGLYLPFWAQRRSRELQAMTGGPGLSPWLLGSLWIFSVFDVATTLRPVTLPTAVENGLLALGLALPVWLAMAMRGLLLAHCRDRLGHPHLYLSRLVTVGLNVIYIQWWINILAIRGWLEPVDPSQSAD